jgi:hypothetical protein
MDKQRQIYTKKWRNKCIIKLHIIQTTVITIKTRICNSVTNLPLLVQHLDLHMKVTVKSLTSVYLSTKIHLYTCYHYFKATNVTNKKSMLQGILCVKSVTFSLTNVCRRFTNDIFCFGQILHHTL